jgi:tetratricopeptide (TPR) repeat protein
MCFDDKSHDRHGSTPRRLLAVAVLMLMPQIALAQTGPAAQSPTGDAAMRVRQAVAALRSDRPEDAVRLYDAALAADSLPNDQRALMHIDRGVARARLGQTRAAVEDFNRAIQLVPEGATAYNNRGTVLLEIGATAEAIRDFDRALLLAPNYAATYTNRAAAHVKLGNHRAALSDYSRAIGLLQTDGAAFAGRGRVHLAQGRPHAALRDLGRALAVAPRFAPALRARAEAYLALERYKDAIDDLGRVLDIDRDNIEVVLLRGYAAIAARDIPAALRDFQHAVTLDPKSSAAVEARGFAEAKAERYEEALNDFSRAIEIDPRSAQAYAYRGWVYKLTGRPELAQKEIERAIGLEPERAEVIWTRGEMLEAMGRADEAIVELRRALELKPMLREAAAALERNGAAQIAASHELDEQSLGEWRLQARGNQYFATNARFPRLTVPLELMGDGLPRLTDWSMRPEASQHIGLLRFTAGTIDGKSGSEEVEHAAVIDTRARRVITIEQVRQGTRAANWTWTDTKLTVAGLEGGTEEYLLVAPVDREMAQQPRRLDGPRYSGGGQAPTWAPWAQGNYGEYTPERRRGGSGGGGGGGGGAKPKTLFDLLFKN